MNHTYCEWCLKDIQVKNRIITEHRYYCSYDCNTLDRKFRQVTADTNPLIMFLEERRKRRAT